MSTSTNSSAACASHASDHVRGRTRERQTFLTVPRFLKAWASRPKISIIPLPSAPGTRLRILPASVKPVIKSCRGESGPGAQVSKY